MKIVSHAQTDLANEVPQLSAPVFLCLPVLHACLPCSCSIPFHTPLCSLLVCSRYLMPHSTSVTVLCGFAQVDAAGLAVAAAAVAPSGEAWAFGDHSGCVRLWSEAASGEQPRMCVAAPDVCFLKSGWGCMDGVWMVLHSWSQPTRPRHAYGPGLQPCYRYWNQAVSSHKL